MMIALTSEQIAAAKELQAAVERNRVTIADFNARKAAYFRQLENDELNFSLGFWGDPSWKELKFELAPDKQQARRHQQWWSSQQRDLDAARIGFELNHTN